MDEIQKVLLKAGRKDLASKYYKKITARMADESFLSKTEVVMQVVDDFLGAIDFKSLVEDIKFECKNNEIKETINKDEISKVIEKELTSYLTKNLK